MSVPPCPSLKRKLPSEAIYSPRDSHYTQKRNANYGHTRVRHTSGVAQSGVSGHVETDNVRREKLRRRPHLRSIGMSPRCWWPCGERPVPPGKTGRHPHSNWHGIPIELLRKAEKQWQILTWLRERCNYRNLSTCIDFWIMSVFLLPLTTSVGLSSSLNFSVVFSQVCEVDIHLSVLMINDVFQIYLCNFWRANFGVKMVVHCLCLIEFYLSECQVLFVYFFLAFLRRLAQMELSDIFSPPPMDLLVFHGIKDSPACLSAQKNKKFKIEYVGLTSFFRQVRARLILEHHFRPLDAGLCDGHGTPAFSHVLRVRELKTATEGHASARVFTVKTKNQSVLNLTQRWRHFSKKLQFCWPIFAL